MRWAIVWTMESPRPEPICSLPSVRVTRALDQVIEWRGKPTAIRSDNGPEYISSTVRDWADGLGIKLMFTISNSISSNEVAVSRKMIYLVVTVR